MIAPALDRRTRSLVAATAVLAVLPLALHLPAASQALLLVCFALGVGAARSGRRLPRSVQALLTLTVLAAALWPFGITGGRLLSRDAGSALLAVMLGLKLAETGSLRDARSILVFGLFAVMAAFLQDQGPVTLLLALAAALATLAALAWLAQLESPDGDGGLAARSPTGLLRGAVWLLIASLPLAAVGFFLFPRLAQPLWGLPQNSELGRTGLSEEMSPGDLAALFSDDTPVLRVSFEGPIPPPAQRYFRGPVFHAFDGRRWTRGLVAGLEARPLEAGPARIGHTVEQEPTDRQYLFALDLPIEVPQGARRDYGQAMLAPRPLTSLHRKRYVSAPDYVLEPAMEAVLRQTLTRLPEGFNPRAVALGRQWGREMREPRRRIERALAWFHESFTYTLSPGLFGRDSVDEFLFERRRGYCEHFAAAFTVLMRASGLPARIVTGYQGGYVNPVGNYLVVLQSDAHAWSEVWIEGEGWVRVDPTRAVSPERIERGSEAIRPASGWGEATRPLRDAVDWLRRSWNQWVLGYGAQQQQRLLRPLGIERADWKQLGAALAVASALALGLTLLWLLRRPPESADPVDLAWRRLRRRLLRAGHPLRPRDGPRTVARRLEGLPELQALCLRYSDFAFGPATRRESAERLRAELQRAQVPRTQRQSEPSAP